MLFCCLHVTIYVLIRNIKKDSCENITTCFNNESSISSQNLGKSSVLEIFIQLVCIPKCKIYVQFKHPMTNIQSISKVFSKAKR